MKDDTAKEEDSDIGKIKEFLLELGFICKSYPSAQNLIYTKSGDIVIIKNNKH